VKVGREGKGRSSNYLRGKGKLVDQKEGNQGLLWRQVGKKGKNNMRREILTILPSRMKGREEKKRTK